MEHEPKGDIAQIIANLDEAGFPAEDILVSEGKVYVGRDAEVSLAASREMIKPDGSSKEQYRTGNLVGSAITKICVDGSTYTGNFSAALDLAIQNYNEQALRFSMARTPSSGCSFTITAGIQPGAAGGVAGFPSGGLPFATITLFDGLAAFSVDVIEHVITHELGHTIGLRHSDYFNRSISCGTGGSEGDAGVGAIHIPGTPTTATVGGSLMNSCFRSSENGEFASTDVTALQALYPRPLPATVYSNSFESATNLSGWLIWHNCAASPWVPANNVFRYYTASDNPVPGGGAYALRMQTTGFAPGCQFPGAYAASPPIAATAGTTYKLDNMSRNHTQSGSVGLIFYNITGNEIGFAERTWTTDAWLFNADAQLVATAPSGTVSFRVRYGLYTPNGVVDLDLLKVVR